MIATADAQEDYYDREHKRKESEKWHSMARGFTGVLGVVVVTLVIFGCVGAAISLADDPGAFAARNTSAVCRGTNWRDETTSITIEGYRVGIELKYRADQVIARDKDGREVRRVDLPSPFDCKFSR